MTEIEKSTEVETIELISEPNYFSENEQLCLLLLVIERKKQEIWMKSKSEKF